MKLLWVTIHCYIHWTIGYCEIIMSYNSLPYTLNYRTLYKQMVCYFFCITKNTFSVSYPTSLKYIDNKVLNLHQQLLLLRNKIEGKIKRKITLDEQKREALMPLCFESASRKIAHEFNLYCDPSPLKPNGNKQVVLFQD